MTPSCRIATCPLTCHPAHDVCYLHLECDRKEREPLLACLAEQEEKGVIRMDGVHLVGADLSDMTLSLRNFRSSDLTGADFSNVRLSRIGFDGSVLDGVDLSDGILEKVDMRRVKSMRETHLHGVILDNVLLPRMSVVGRRCTYDGSERHDPERAEAVYRVLKEAYKNQGEHETSGIFYEQEMDMRRLCAQGFERLWLTALRLTCGYGERPWRAIVASFVVVLAYAVVFMFLDLRGPDGELGPDILECSYFSTITFTTVGYGDIIPFGAARYVAATEAFFGAWMMALFVFVFCRRMVR